MNLTANYRPRIRVDSIIHVRRQLIGVGDLAARKGQEVAPSDILGKSEKSAGFFSVSLAKELGVGRGDGAKYLQRSLGSKIYKGELLALKKNLLGKKIITSPTDGIIEAYDASSGELRLKFLPKVMPLTSGVFGIVDDINPTTGEVWIKTIVTEIIGLLGAGNERGGVLNILSSGSGLVSATQISPNLAHHIVVAGSLIYGETLKRAVENGVNGIVTGGLNAKDYRAMTGSLNPSLKIGTDPGFSVLATEGFGSIGIGGDILASIKKYENKFVFLNGNTERLMLPSIDPDIIIRLRKVALPVKRQPEGLDLVEYKEINLGDKVRIVWPPFAGWQGKVIAIDKGLTSLSSGISTFLVIVETQNRKIKVPYPNIELI